jgi:hypothetical protein
LRRPAGDGFDGNGIIGRKFVFHFFAGSLRNQFCKFIAGRLIIGSGFIRIPYKGDLAGIIRCITADGRQAAGCHGKHRHSGQNEDGHGFQQFSDFHKFSPFLS